MRKEIFSGIVLFIALLAGCSFVYVKSQVDVTNEVVKEILLEEPVPVVVPVPEPTPEPVQPKVDETQEAEPEPEPEPNPEATAKNFEEWFEAVDMPHPDKSTSRHIYENIKKDPFFSGMTIISIARSGSSVVITARNSMQISSDIRWTYLCDWRDINRNVVSPIGTTMTYIGEKN